MAGLQGAVMLVAGSLAWLPIGLEAPNSGGDDTLISRDVSVQGASKSAYGAFAEEKEVKEVVDRDSDRSDAPVVAVYRGGGGERDGASASSPGDDFEWVGVCLVTDAERPVSYAPDCEQVVAEESVEPADEGESAGGSEPIIITVTRSDFAELPLELPVVHLQPERDWFLVNMDTLVFADGGQQVLETSVLGVPVAVRATPVEYVWDFGDGTEPLVTTDPGAPWPAQDVGHMYTSEASGVVITLTTTWSGEFQVAGQGPWIPIAGTTTTQSQSAPFRIEAVETHLTAQG